MQTEMRLRLLMKGKIVGYEIKQIYHQLVPNSNIISTWKSADQEVYYPNDKPFDYDSFELGVKVGETWYYEGDLFKCSKRHEGNFTGELCYSPWNWYICHGEYTTDLQEMIYEYRIERIGNIHEGNPNA